MRNVGCNIYGGTAVRYNTKRTSVSTLPVLALLVTLLLSSSAFAQGSIFGTVSNSDLTTPANGEISFVGFLDDTDEEIRIETSAGAGYDAGNWFDDFQNYLTEAPGNPYDYYFINLVNGEAYHLESSIPSNSFQQENIALAIAALPSAPTGLAGSALSGSTILVEWNGVAGLTYHLYRRNSGSTGSFFRVDNPAGDLLDAGLVDSFFVDNTVDGISLYDYVLIAEDASGNYSSHSTVVSISSAGSQAPTITSISPSNGPAVGGTTVSISGNDFDPNGVSVQFGAAVPVSATVISPYQITATTPPGPIGPADIVISNLSSALSSNTLIGAYNYDANTQPVLAAIGAQSALENDLLTFGTSASDVDGDTPLLSASALPSGATYVDNLDGTGTFNWQTDFTSGGVYNIMFYATDAINNLLVDSEAVVITINEAGNQAPVVAAMNNTTMVEGGSLVLTVLATDADGEIPTLSVVNAPANATFVDNTDGSGTFTFNPDLTQSGVYNVTFKALDASLAVDSQVVQITVNETNQAPVLALPVAQVGTENVILTFLINGSDGDGTAPVLSALNLPVGATFVDSLNGVGLVSWTPDFTQAGIYDISFYATDGIETDSGIVNVTIAEAGNQTPVLAAIGAQTTNEGANLAFAVSASDVDGTIPALSAVNLPLNATFIDNLDGTGSFDFSPAFDQAGLITVTFIASDGTLADSEFVDITVNESGNQAPIFVIQNDTTVNEGDVLAITITANDPDGGAFFPILSVNTSLQNYTFLDNGDGTASFSYSPDFIDAGIDTVNFFATDFGTPQQTGNTSFVITTTDVNQAPLWTVAGPFGIAVGDTLSFTIIVSDSTDPNLTNSIFLSVLTAIPNASFVDNGDGTGTYTFVPDATQAGINTVSFLAVDQGLPQLSSTIDIEISVVTTNIRPVLAPIGAQTVTEGDLLILNVSATDADGAIPTLSGSGLPENSTFVDNGDGSGVFTFFPNFVQSGLHSVTVKASDGFSTAKEVVLVQVYEAGDQAPVFGALPATTMVEGDTLEFVVTASDPDEGSITLNVVGASMPAFVSFTDESDGVGRFIAEPFFLDAGVYAIDLIASDGILADTITITLDVADAGNQLPVLAALTDQQGIELKSISFNIYTQDIDGTEPPLITGALLPTGATVTDNRDGTGLFSWIPTDLQEGSYDILILAEDFDVPTVMDTEFVSIIVIDSNRAPRIVTMGPASVFEGDTLVYVVFADDPDGTIPAIGARIDGETSLTEPNMVMVDSGNGIGVLTFYPDYSQGGTSSSFYYIRFFATDAADPGLVKDATAPVQITVNDRNAPPEFVFINGEGPFTVTEGDNVTFQIGATDFDGSSAPMLSMTGSPANATFSTTPGFGTFRFSPDFTQAGTYNILFIATDDRGLSISQSIQVDVIEAGNQAPYFSNTINDTINIAVNALSQILVRSIEPDLDLITLTATPMWSQLFAGFVDSGNGSGVYSVTPDNTYLDSMYAIEFIATDPFGLADTVSTVLRVVSFLRGDLDNNKKYTMNDLAWLIGYLFRGGEAPAIPESADVDKDNDINIGDVTYMIRFLYNSGPQPPQ